MEEENTFFRLMEDQKFNEALSVVRSVLAQLDTEQNKLKKAIWLQYKGMVTLELRWNKVSLSCFEQAKLLLESIQP